MALTDWLKGLRIGRRRAEPQRDTIPFPNVIQIGQQRVGSRILWKPTPKNLRYFSRTPYARRAINAIKNPIAMLEWEIVPIPGVDLNPELERQIEIARACLETPNRDDDFRSFREQVIEDILVGAGAIEKQLSGDALRPLWMWPVDGLSIQMFPGWGGGRDEARYCQSVGYGSYTGGGPTVMLRDDELIYIRPNPSTATPFGFGPLEVAFNTISRQLGVGDFAGNVASNARPSILLDMGEGASDQTLAAFRSYWQTDIEGQGKVPIIASKGGDVHKLYPDGDNALFLKYQEFLKVELATAFDLSPMNLGVERDVNRNCYSEDTETLTPDGWRRLDELSEDSIIAAFNPQTRAVEFTKPDLMHVADYEGDMIHISGRMTDALVTPDHRMWVRRLGPGDGSKIAGDGYEILPASALESGRYATIASFAMPDHPRVETFTLPGCDCGGGVRRSYPDREIAMDDWLAFLGFHISEGHAGRHGAGTWKVNLCQNKGTETAAEIDALISRLPFAFAINDSGDGVRRWQVADKALCAWLLEHCGRGAHSKRLPAFVANLGAEQRAIVFDALMKGDGTRSVVPGRKSGAYYTASAQLRDDVQMLATSLGHRAVATSNPIMGVYRVKITDRTAENEIKGIRNVRRVSYLGRVYCFSVAPHHLFVTRRNGKIAVHGNTAEVSAERDRDHAIKPWATLLAANITRGALHRGLGFWQLMLRFPGLDPDDEDLNSQVFEREWRSNAVTPDEYRERRGMPPMDSEWGQMTYADVQIAINAARGAGEVDDPDLEKKQQARLSGQTKPKRKKT